MRKYRIYKINSNNAIYSEADTPQEAIRNIYKGYDTYIEPADIINANHKVELINHTRKSINYYKVELKSLNRKNKNDNYIEPMPKKQLYKIIKEFKARGGLIIINDDIDKFLRKQGAEGSTLNENTILLVKNPSRSAVYEELIHAEQYKQGKNNGSRESRLICEIEAQKELIKRKEELCITDKEDIQTRKALKEYEKSYKNIINNK